jgi:hypothetical protein
MIRDGIKGALLGLPAGMNNRSFPKTYLWIIIFMLLKVGRRKNQVNSVFLRSQHCILRQRLKERGLGFKSLFPGQAVAL